MSAARWTDGEWEEMLRDAEQEVSALQTEKQQRDLELHNAYEAIEVQRRDVVAFAEDNQQLREALESALCELGVPPVPDYPAPVANAVAILQAALAAGRDAP